MYGERSKENYWDSRKTFADADKDVTECAREILQNYSPKPIGTCRANNKVAIDYDLQIIVPCYNVEKYIRQCLDSILKQRTNYRVLISIVNDGSTDGTADILQQLLWEANTEKMMGGTLLS